MGFTFFFSLISDYALHDPPPGLPAEPFTSRRNPGAFVPMPTPPPARIRNWSAAVEMKLESVESAQTKEPAFAALARRPAARE